MILNLKTTAEAVLTAKEKDETPFQSVYGRLAHENSESLAQGYLNLLKKYEILEEGLDSFSTENFYIKDEARGQTCGNTFHVYELVLKAKEFKAKASAVCK